MLTLRQISPITRRAISPRIAARGFRLASGHIYFVCGTRCVDDNPLAPDNNKLERASYEVAVMHWTPDTGVQARGSVALPSAIARMNFCLTPRPQLPGAKSGEIQRAQAGMLIYPHGIGGPVAEINGDNRWMMK
jgi:hypothetical protein